jgi:hypothetical protein
MLPEALAQLEDATKEGKRDPSGNAHLAVISALGEMAEEAESAEQIQGFYRQMMGHVDAALSVYDGLDPPWGLCQAHLVKAAILADLAEGEESEQGRLAHVGQSLYHCHQALTILSETEEFHYQILTEAHATAVTILLRLRALVEGDEVQQVLDGMIEAYSENLGASVAWDIRHQGQGNDLLFMAGMLDTLAEGLEDPEERLEAVQTAFETALEATELLRRTGDPDLARAACDLAEKTKRKIEVLEATVAKGLQGPICPHCAHENPPGNAFCGQCGASLDSDLETTIALQTQTLACSKCGHLSAPGKKFCTQCGAPLG